MKDNSGIVCIICLLLLLCGLTIFFGFLSPVHRGF